MFRECRLSSPSVVEVDHPHLPRASLLLLITHQSSHKQPNRLTPQEERRSYDRAPLRYDGLVHFLVGKLQHQRWLEYNRCHSSVHHSTDLLSLCYCHDCTDTVGPWRLCERTSVFKRWGNSRTVAQQQHPSIHGCEIDISYRNNQAIINRRVGAVLWWWQWLWQWWWQW